MSYPTLFAVENLTEQKMVASCPWEFIQTEAISAQVRGDKVARQAFYQTVSVRHNFYTGVEPLNPNCRPSKTTNAPHRLHAAVADYDLPLEDERVLAAVKKFKFKPAWFERSLGGNARLVWLFEMPIPLDSFEFAVFALKELRTFLQLDLLPGLDEGAWEDPTRLYCNGCAWVDLKQPPIPRVDLQAFFVKCGQGFHFKDATIELEVPLDVVEKALLEKFGPAFNWPGSFELNAQGPTFWIPESTSPMSAIIKTDGIFTFSAHAERSFYSWKDLLGADFVSKFETDCIGRATDQIYFDGVLYWAHYPQQGRFCGAKENEISRHLRVNFRVSAKPDKTGISTLDRCLDHIHKVNRVKGGAPVLFHPLGALHTDSGLIVNTATKSRIIVPADGEQVWGDHGNFAMISRIIDNLFDPADQKDAFLAWLRHFYTTALAQKPEPGQNIFMAGGPGVGKTMTNRLIVGKLMGGFVDASRFLTGNGDFNSHLFEASVWSVDDETISDSDATHRKFTSAIKLAAANQAFLYNRKYEHSVMVPWMGRIIVTLNLDESSTRTLPSLDGTILDKISFFRCVEVSKVIFPNRYALAELIKQELPFFARWLISWEVPARLLGESRYGVRAHHESSLIDKAHQSSKTAPFKELVVDFLTEHFQSNPESLEWKGSVTELMRVLSANPMNEVIVRTLRLDQVNRHLEALAREGVLNIASENGSRKTRIWKFSNFVKTPPPPTTLHVLPQIVPCFK